MSVKDESVEGLPAFNARIKELESAKPKPTIIVVFSGSLDALTKRSWCSDCNRLDAMLPKLKPKMPAGSVLIHVYIGSRLKWSEPDNPFRTDTKIKLTIVPTIVIWGTAKKLTPPQILNENLLKMLFED